MGIDAGTPPGLWERVRKIAAEEVAKFMRSGFLRNASITGGGLTIKGGFLKVLFPESQGGALGAYFGDIVNANNPTEYQGTGMLIQGPDGTDILTARSDAASGSTMARLHDGGGVIFVGNDFTTGQGMARPFVGGGFARARFADWSVATTSSTFETLYSTHLYKQQPRLEVSVRASMDTAATNGELRVLVDGTPLAGVTNESFALATRYFEGPIAGAHMEPVFVEIQARVTSGSGALRVMPRYWVGKQAPV